MKYRYLILVILLSACTKEEITLYYAYIKNTTSHKIEIHPYFNGIVPSDKIIILHLNDSIRIANGFDRGLVSYGFSSSYFGGPNDSVIVLFDDIYKITHYFNTPSSLSNKYYLFSSTRNIGNPHSYRIESYNLSKYKRKNIHTYEFIEQDFLDAK